ncbi:EF-hand domain-containing protein [Aphelenchoides besseyi]|nr:EF-hand domain-containing protein [Aphelenchoides besseyi]KAI6235231.1 EF-hand domain-containing protein [Aphelenchoides besseyi]
MNGLVIIFLLGVLTPLLVAPPPNRQAASQATEAPVHSTSQTPQTEDQKPIYQFAYSKYLEQVVKILEGDEKFRDRIKTMNEDDIKTGKIADHIEDLSPDVFDQLTKAKLSELERLREQIDQDIKRTGDASKIAIPDHIDVYNWEKFHKEDLRKLILKTVEHMDEIDRNRREQFKEYEMKKKAEEDHRLNQLPPKEREEELRKLDESKKRHKEHEKVKHPGGREQLEEVWEETDHMDKDSFDPKTFFALHDLNGDGYWNDDELEALFQIELAKVYNETDPDDDPREKVEEMYRMREHVVGQMDKNKDRLISLDEFLQDNEATVDDKKPDAGWDDIADTKLYTDEELQQFEKEYAKQQGWGEGAYDPITDAPSHLDQNPHHQVPVQHPPQQPLVNHQPQQPEVVTPKAPKVVDPVYGV